MNIIFFGTPEIAIPSLEALAKDDSITIRYVVTQPDKIQGRKKILTAPPIKIAAQDLGYEVFQPKSKKELYEKLKTENVDFFVVIAFGMILGQKILDIPKISPINIHASILPKYRGASPIQTALKNGDKESGISIMKMILEMDKGPIYKIEKIKIEENDTYQTLSQKLGKLAGEKIVKTLKHIKKNSLLAKKQNESLASHCKMIKKEDGEILKNDNIDLIYNKYRAYKTWPEIYIKSKEGKKIKLKGVKKSQTKQNKDGFIFENKKLYYCKNSKCIEILKLQIEGKKETDAKNFYNGYKNLLNL